MVSSLALLGLLAGDASAEPRKTAPVIDAEGRLPYVRTRECAPRQTSARKDFWEQARAPKLAAFCDRLAQAEALLDASPQEAFDAAVKADELLAGRAAPLVIQGRAMSALGRPSEAVETLKKAQAIDPVSLEHASTLYAFATAQRDIQDRAGSADSFRSLVSRVSLLPPALRPQALFDAASQLLALGGQDTADEAIAIVRSALVSTPQSIRPLFEAYLSLALDRRGVRLESAGMAAAATRGGVLTTWLQSTHPELLRALPEERLALTARMREGSDPASALSTWEGMLAAAPSSPWAAHARARIAELKKSAGAHPAAHPAPHAR